MTASFRHFVSFFVKNKILLEPKNHTAQPESLPAWKPTTRAQYNWCWTILNAARLLNYPLSHHNSNKILHNYSNKQRRQHYSDDMLKENLPGRELAGVAA